MFVCLSVRNFSATVLNGFPSNYSCLIARMYRPIDEVLEGQGQRSRSRSRKRSKHIIDHNFYSNWSRHLMLRPYVIVTQGPSHVTLTLTFDLDLKSSVKVKVFQKIELFVTLSSSISNQRTLSNNSRSINFLTVWRRWTSQ